MRIKGLLRYALLLTLAALLLLALSLAGIVGYALYTAGRPNAAIVPIDSIDKALTLADGEYAFDGGELLDRQSLWAMLIDEGGDVIWSEDLPADVPEHYTINQVAAFSKWFLRDYPVNTRIRDDGLLVIGSPKGSVWKYNYNVSMNMFGPGLAWTGLTFALALLCVVGLSALLLRRWFHREQAARDSARSGWINGVSHDIRTPLSLVMGYAAELEGDEALPPRRREQAAVMLRQSETIKELVSDLNLTMRLDYDMEPLRMETVSPAALARQAAADLINRGLDSRYTLTPDIPDGETETLRADPALILRALSNLLNNCVQHNPKGCEIRLSVARDRRYWRLAVESVATEEGEPEAPESSGLGEPPHGTGLKLVGQIARAHRGRATFETGQGRFKCTISLRRER